MTNTEIAPLARIDIPVVGPTSVIPSRWSAVIAAVLAVSFFAVVLTLAIMNGLSRDHGPVVLSLNPDDDQITVVNSCLMAAGWRGIALDGHSGVYAPTADVLGCGADSNGDGRLSDLELGA
jgi:hypothetical protein